jgi:glycosyltransferase involved in cell wall biosynthesis
VVTPCQALATYAREHVGVPRDRVHTVPNGVAARWLAEGHGVRTDHAPVRATWLGVMAPVKRVPDLVRAAARVPGLELELVGDGPERARIEGVVAATGSGPRVRLTGYQADPSPYLHGADVFVLPSAAEACPMALLQAMACGVPVVATRVGGVPEIVRDGVDGVLVDPGDEDQLTAALALLVGDPALRRTLGRAGRARVAERFGIEHSVRSLVSIYERLAS